MRRHRAQCNIKPSLATHFSSLSRSPDAGLDIHMFTEDIHLAIMPIGGRKDNQKNFAAELIGEDSDCMKAKEIIGDMGEFDEYDLPAMVCDAIDNIAMSLACEGQAVFEIIKDQDRVFLSDITSKNLFKVFCWYVQIIPPGDWNLWKRKFSFVSAKKIWKVKIPHELGGVSGYKRILRRLGKSARLGPEFYRQDIERGKTTKDFDLMKYVRSRDIYINQVTRTWGWNRRDWTQEKCTEFYSFYRMLNFRYAQAILREHIIEEINCLFERLSIRGKLVVEGLPTATEILQIRDDMGRGKISFAQASDKVLM